jgi:hypothetical protein
VPPEPGGTGPNALAVAWLPSGLRAVYIPVWGLATWPWAFAPRAAFGASATVRA